MSAGVHEKGRRLRWKLRGAWLWPAFAVATLLEMLLLHWLPLAGEDTGLLAALLLAGCLNIIAVALFGGLGGVWLRRRRPDLPKVVADNYAGTAALAGVLLVVVVVGLAHRPQISDERDDLARQRLAVAQWVGVHGDAFTRAHVAAATTVRVDSGLYRTCVPSPDPQRWTCLVVDTAGTAPRVRRDANRESNASFSPRGGFR
jgi:hypothetical protein